MKRLKKLWVLFLLPVLLLTGCWQEEVDENTGIVDGSASLEDAGEQLPLPKSLSLPYYPDQTLDPVTCPDGIQQTVAALLYEGLFALDETLTPRNSLCVSGTHTPDALTWTFALRSGVTFSDGSPLTAADVSATLNRARTAPRYRSRLSGLVSVSAPDSASVAVVLSAPNACLPALLDIPIVKADTQNSLVPVGTGPYAFTLDGSDGPALTANTRWWGGTVQPVERIELAAAENRDIMLYQFSSHDIQLITADLTGTQPVSATSNVSFYDADTTVFQYVGFNMAGLFADPALRSALSLGVNRANIVSAFLSSHARGTQFPVCPVSPAYPAALEDGYSYEAFEQAMTRAGYNTGAAHSATLLVNSENGFKVSVARQIAAALSVFDLNITVEALPWAEYTAALAAGRYDLYYGEVKLTADWDLRPLLSTGGALNYGRYTDPALDALLAEYAAAPDPQTVMERVCRYLKQHSPILPVCFKRVSVLTQEGVIENLTPTAANPFYGLDGCVIHLADR